MFYDTWHLSNGLFPIDNLWIKLFMLENESHYSLLKFTGDMGFMEFHYNCSYDQQQHNDVNAC